MKRTMTLAATTALIALIAGCGGEFAAEKATLGTMTEAVQKLNEKVAESDAPEELASALSAFAGTMEKVGPKLKEISDAHPEWQDEAPEALKDIQDKFMQAQNDMMSKTMPKIMQTLQEHGDNEELKTAFEKMMSLGEMM